MVARLDGYALWLLRMPVLRPSWWLYTATLELGGGVAGTGDWAPSCISQ
jgi:hypothetical protein